MKFFPGMQQHAFVQWGLAFRGRQQIEVSFTKGIVHLAHYRTALLRVIVEIPKTDRVEYVAQHLGEGVQMHRALKCQACFQLNLAH